MRVQKVRGWITGAVALLVIALMLAPSLMAQSLVSGDITGTVTDPSGAVVPKATVAIKNNSTGATRTVTSNAAGAYRFSLLPPGNYTVTASAPGFNKAQTTTSVTVGQATIADVKMQVGTSATTVEVTSAAPLVNAENANLSTNFNQTIIANQPNPGNDLTYIAQTAPGVNMNSGMGYGNFNTAGLPATANVFTMNGENQMDPYLSLNNSGASNLMLGRNDVQEATVVTNAYSGQYGQEAGAQVNYVSKSGTNAFHGNAEYFWTGSSMDANSYLNNLTGAARPFNNNNQWAGSIGGPIKKDKLFFFLDTEGLTYIVPSTQTVYAPTTAFAGATLANLAATNPTEVGLYSKAFSLYQGAPGYNTGTPVPGSCGAGFSGPAINCFQSWTGNPTEPASEFLGIGRIDYNLSDRDHLFWSVSADHGTQATGADPINPAFNVASYQPQYNGQGQWTHTLGSNATNQLIYAGSYYRAIFSTADGPATFPGQLDMAGLGFTSLGGQFGGGGQFIFPQGRNVTQYQFVDDFSWTHGNHTIKVGGNFLRYDVSDYTFAGGVGAPLSVIGSVNDFYNGYANAYLANYPSQLSQPVALWNLGAYVQDEWRVSKSLKLTFALRAEHFANPVCNTNCASQLTGSFGEASVSPTTPYNQMIMANQNSIFRSTDAINWAPRFGFAWSPGGSDKTVVRGGFGIFYDAFPAAFGDTFMLNAPGYIPMTLGGLQPWANTVTPGVSPSLISAGSAAAIRSGFANGASFASLSAGVPGFAAPNFGNALGTFHTPQYQEWNLQIEQQLDDKSSMTIGYIGNHGVDEPVLNYPNAYGGFAGIPGAPLNGNFGTVSQVYAGAVSNDNQLTASYQRRLTYGFTISASYTWAHAIDEISNGGFAGTPYSSTSAVYQLNPFNLASNYGNADYDIRNSFNAQYVWQTPWKFSNKWIDGAFGGWTLSQNFFARSGLPLTVFDLGSGLGNYNPAAPYLPAQVIGGGQGACNQYLTGCLNAGGFTSPAGLGLGAFPNQGRNAFRGPAFFDSDFSVNKNFKLTERVAFGLGANMYNVFNHSNFANPVNFFGAPNFGQINLQAVPPTSPFGSFFAGAPSNRIIQFQGKIVF